MTVEKLKPSGAILISDIVKGQFVKIQYQGWSIKSAKENFKNFVKHAAKHI